MFVIKAVCVVHMLLIAATHAQSPESCTGENECVDKGPEDQQSFAQIGVISKRISKQMDVDKKLETESRQEAATVEKHTVPEPKQASRALLTKRSSRRNDCCDCVDLIKTGDVPSLSDGCVDEISDLKQARSWVEDNEGSSGGCTKCLKAAWKNCGKQKFCTKYWGFWHCPNNFATLKEECFEERGEELCEANNLMCDGSLLEVGRNTSKSNNKLTNASELDKDLEKQAASSSASLTSTDETLARKSGDC